MKLAFPFLFLVALATVMLAVGGATTSTTPVTVEYGNSVPASCQASSPVVFIQRGSTGLVTISTCLNGTYNQIWQAERFADGETPSGAIDGTNSTFTLAHLPQPATSLQLTKNGLVQRQGVDYTLDQQTITLTVAPSASTSVTVADTLEAWYRY